MKICTKCKAEKELNDDNFPKRKLRDGSYTWHSYCRQCRRKTRIGEYKRGKNDEEIKKHRRGYQKVYGQTFKGKAIRLLKAYRNADKKRGYTFDLPQQWFIDNILKSKCYYCESVEQIGADRLDNSIGHIVYNVVPCCSVCNSVRSDIFTVDEMIVIGQTIKKLRTNRDIFKLSGNSKKSKNFKPYKKIEIINEKVA